MLQKAILVAAAAVLAQMFFGVVYPLTRVAITAPRSIVTANTLLGIVACIPPVTFVAFLWQLYKETVGRGDVKRRRAAALAAAGGEVIVIGFQVHQMIQTAQLGPLFMERMGVTADQVSAMLTRQAWTQIGPSLLWLVLLGACVIVRFPWRSAFVRALALVLAGVTVVTGVIATYRSVAAFANVTVSNLYLPVSVISTAVRLVGWIATAVFLLLLYRGVSLSPAAATSSGRTAPPGPS